jgi:hypothetical protein
MPYLSIYCAGVTNSLNDITGPSLTLGPDHGCTLTYSAKRFTEVSRAAHKGDFKGMLIDMMGFIGWCEHF